MKRGMLICAGLMGLIVGSAAPPASESAFAAAVAAPVRATAAAAVAAVPAPPPPRPVVTPARASGPGPVPAAPAHVAVVTSGTVRVLVSIPEQRAYVFRGNALIATSPVSTGRRGHSTPTGTFPIMEKDVEHYSSLYNNAPMPYMQRLTAGGVALHGGRVPGYPASHGCIRLPHAFARRLYNLTRHGTRVTVTRTRPRSTQEALSLAV